MVTTIYDYVDKILEKFPFLSKKEIESILFRGFRMLHMLMKWGIPLHIRCRENNSSLKFLIGDFAENIEKYEEIRRKKAKLICMLRHEKSDGYYYISVDEKKHKELLDQPEEKTFLNVYIYKYKYLLKYVPKNSYIWRFKTDEDFGIYKFIKSYSTKNAEYYGTKF